MNKGRKESDIKIRVHSDTKDALEKLAAEETAKTLRDVSVSDLVRDAIRDYLNMKDPKAVRAAKVKAANEERL